MRSGLVPERLDTSSAATCTFPPCPASVGDARRFTRQTLDQWGLDDILGGVELVASELVTNALRYGFPADRSDAPVQVSFARWTSRVVCAVRDTSMKGPVAKTPDWVAESGRGLYLVESVTETWGWHPLAGTGKVVWALFALSDPG